MAKSQAKNNGRGTKTGPRKKRDMFKFTKKLLADTDKLFLTKSSEVAGRFLIDRLKELAPEEKLECDRWMRFLDLRQHGLNVIDA